MCFFFSIKTEKESLLTLSPPSMEFYIIFDTTRFPPLMEFHCFIVGGAVKYLLKEYTISGSKHVWKRSRNKW